MSAAHDTQILGLDGPVAEVVHPEGRAPLCLVCEHASAEIPAALGDLGLARADRYSHAVWDIGAEALARALAERLDAPLVLSRVSRLVYDCNRPPERPDAMPAQTETIAIPGNSALSPEARAARAAAVYEPFHATLAAQLERMGGRPAFVTVHSFTPVWMGTPRRTEIGLLHDADARLARAMQAAGAPGLGAPGFSVELNQPYSAADGVTHTLARHATARGLPNVMIEVRNDLLASPAQVVQMAEALGTMLTRALSGGACAA